MKLIEFELSMEGLSKRSQIFAKLEGILGKDWGDAETVLQGKADQGARLRDRAKQEEELHARYKILERMLSDAS